MSNEIALADAVELLREELLDAIARGKDQPLQFQLDPIELTLQTVVTKNAHGQVGWKILEAGAEREKAVTQTVSLRLTPLWRKEDGSLTKDFAITSNVPGGAHFGPHK